MNGRQYLITSIFIPFNFSDPPIIQNMPEEQRVSYGEYAVLKCMAKAYPAPTIAWSLNGQPLNSTSRHFLAAEGCLLVIVDVGHSDEGTYRCTVTNVLGKQKDETVLTIAKGMCCSHSIGQCRRTS